MIFIKYLYSHGTHIFSPQVMTGLLTAAGDIPLLFSVVSFTGQIQLMEFSNALISLNLENLIQNNDQSQKSDRDICYKG